MRPSKTLAMLVLFLLVISVGLGMLAQQANPNGIFLQTPPANGSDTPLNAFAFGFVFGSTTISICYAIAMIVVALYGLITKRPMMSTVLQIAGAVLIGFTLTLVINYQTISSAT